jgi:hypothetical protein
VLSTYSFECGRLVCYASYGSCLDSSSICCIQTQVLCVGHVVYFRGVPAPVLVLTCMIVAGRPGVAIGLVVAVGRAHQQVDVNLRVRSCIYGSCRSCITQASHSHGCARRSKDIVHDVTVATAVGVDYTALCQLLC